jgi:hypothetical protein
MADLLDQDFEALAHQYRADGYTGSVVARKLISQHGMQEAAANALVGSLYGTSVDPRAGDTSSAVVVGLLMLTAGGLLVWWCVDLLFSQPYTGSRSGRLPTFGVVVGGSLAATGLKKVFFALVNRNANEPLRRE